jgi:hypothetical protein
MKSKTLCYLSEHPISDCYDLEISYKGNSIYQGTNERKVKLFINKFWKCHIFKYWKCEMNWVWEKLKKLVYL